MHLFSFPKRCLLAVSSLFLLPGCTKKGSSGGNHSGGTHSYEVKIRAPQSGTAGMTIGGAIDQYLDSASLEVDVAGDSVSITHIVNQPPIVAPTSGLGPDGQTMVQWAGDNLGVINITGGNGSIQAVGNLQAVTVTLTSQGTTTPKWQFTGGGVSYSVGGDNVPGYPGAFSFVLADSAQTQAQGNIVIIPGN